MGALSPQDHLFETFGGCPKLTQISVNIFSLQVNPHISRLRPPRDQRYAAPSLPPPASAPKPPGPLLATPALQEGKQTAVVDGPAIAHLIFMRFLSH